MATTTSETILGYGPKIGSLLGRPLYDWLDLPDGRYIYDGMAPGPRAGIVDLRLVRDDQVLLAPGVCYCKVAR